MIERYLIRYFLAVAHHGNFTRAAENCHVSQPTLSAGIAKLEREMGGKLLRRSNRRIELTDAGARLLGHARRIESEFNLAQQIVSAETSNPLMRIGILSSIPTNFITKALAMQTQAERADNPVELIIGSERDLTGRLERGRIDLALTLVGRGVDRVAEKPFAEEGYALAICSDHPLAHEAEIAGENLAGEVMIVRRHCEALAATSRHFTQRGVRPHFALRSTHDDMVLHYVAAGLGLTVMPVSHQYSGVSRPRLTGFDLTRKLGLMVDPSNAAFLDSPPNLIEKLEEVIVGSLTHIA